MKQNIQIERVFSELKRGEKIIICDNLSQISVLLSAAERVNNTTLKEHTRLGHSNPTIILSKTKCNALGIKAKNHCSFIVDTSWSNEEILEMAITKKFDFQSKVDGLIQESNLLIDYCLELLKKSKLLPTGIMTLISRVDFDKIKPWAEQNKLICIDTNDIQSYGFDNISSLEIIAKAHLPIKQTDECDFLAFRPKIGTNEYFCLLIGKARNLTKNKLGFVPTLRIHSQCITGDILNSLKCDCGDQLKSALSLMAKNKEGILIYLMQEGRNIGLTNKLRAYQLQEEGLDTVDANLTLGFEEDERTYEVACEILKALNVQSVKLITNNPHKVDELEKFGLKIDKRIPLSIKQNKYNENYLNTKKSKAGHIFF